MLGCTSAPLPFDAGQPVPVAAAVVSHPLGLGETQVVAWLHWQRQVAERCRVDGGASTQPLLARVACEEAERIEVGLSDAEVEAVEALLAAVLAQRAAGGANEGDWRRELKVGIEQLEPEQRLKAEAALGGTGDSSRGLAAIEGQYGQSAVAAALAHEREVAQVWETLLER